MNAVSRAARNPRNLTAYTEGSRRVLGALRRLRDSIEKIEDEELRLEMARDLQSAVQGLDAASGGVNEFLAELVPPSTNRS